MQSAFSVGYDIVVNLTRAVTNAQNLRRIRTKSGPLVLKFYTWLKKFYSNFYWLPKYLCKLELAFGSGISLLRLTQWLYLASRLTDVYWLSVCLIQNVQTNYYFLTNCPATHKTCTSKMWSLEAEKNVWALKLRASVNTRRWKGK